MLIGCTVQLKCSGDKSGCERCRVASRLCTYPPNAYGDNPADKRRRQSRDTSFEREDNLRPALHQQPEAVVVDTGAVASGSHSPTPPATFANLSWTLPSTPSGTDLLWDFPSDENQHIMDDHQGSSFGNTLCRKSASDSRAFPTQGKRLQTPIGDVEVDDDIADILYDLSPSQLSNPLSNQSSTSSTTLSTSGMLKSNRSSSEPSRQGNTGLSQEVHGARLYETEGLQSGAGPWRTTLNLTSSLDQPVQHSHTPRMHGSSTNGLAASTMASLSATSGYAAIPMSTSAHPREHTMNPAPGSSCLCISMMLKTLENMGNRGSGTDARDSGVGLDVILMSLASAMDTIEKILACRQCNACIDNSMLLAAIAQQLGMMAENVVTYWSSQEQPYGSYASQKRRRRHGSSSQSRQLSDLIVMDTDGPTIHSSSNDDPICDIPELSGAGIVLGRYEIQAPEIRSQLVHHALLLHTDKLCTVLGHIKNRLSSNWGARKLVMNIETRVREFWELLRSRLLYPEIVLGSLSATSNLRV
jgi:hypothetical protein